MKKILLLLSWMSYLALAQEIPNKVLELPQKYKLPAEDVNLYANAQTIPGVVWQVYSDRDNNVTYKTPGGSEKYKTVNFLDNFFIVAENREYVRIITESKVMETGNLFEDFGWIKKENLLLWNHCLITSNVAQDKQVLVVNTSDHYRLTPMQQMTGHKMAPAFSHPAEFNKQLEQVGLYDIYYVYKESEDAMLVGNSLRFNSTGDNIDQVILGWIPKNRLTTWNYKLFLEPNVNKEAMKEMKGVSKLLFHDKVSAGIYKRKKIVQAEYILWSNEGDNKRMPGNKYRFPVMEEKNGIFKVGFLGEVTFWENEKGKIDQLKKDESPIVSPFTHEIKDYLWQLDSTQAKLKWAYDNSYQMFEAAYTIRDIDDQNYALYQFATVKDGYELTEINEVLGFFSNVIANAKKKRDRLVQGYLSILKDYADLSDDAIRELTLAEANNYIFGIPAASLQDGIKIKDLENESLIDKDAYNNFTDRFQNLQKEYERMLNDDEYEFSFQSNDTRYYWINEELVP